MITIKNLKLVCLDPTENQEEIRENCDKTQYSLESSKALTDRTICESHENRDRDYKRVLLVSSTWLSDNSKDNHCL